jgi:hypothetical protein
MGLATIYYGLRYETSHFDASYASQVTVEVFAPGSTRGTLAQGYESSLMLRPTVSLPFYLGTKHPSGAYDQIYITVRQLRVF